MTSAPLRFSSVRCFPIRLDFTLDVAHSLASRLHTTNVCARFDTVSGVTGYGEGVPRHYVTGETPAGALAILREMAPALLNIDFPAPDYLLNTLRHLGRTTSGASNPSAFCALELAALDAAGKHWDRPIRDLLGLAAATAPLVYSLVVPLLPEHTLEAFLEHAAGFTFSAVKVKVNGNDPADRVRRVQGRLGDTTAYRVDANCGWTREAAHRAMREMADLGVESVEQPLAANDLEGMTALRGHGVLITLDESVAGLADVRTVADAGACDIVNVRISKCGGLLRSLEVIETARECGLGVQLGAQVGESCILSAAGAHLAAGVPEFRWREGFFGTHLLASDLCAGDMRFSAGGLVTPPEGPGLGIAIDPDRLDAAAGAAGQLSESAEHV
jgi:muconate cycloisomerase